jgi:hypothetical protein
MIERIRRKLDEARFFYDHLVKKRPQAMNAFGHDPRAFRYYFSAFIQAARSVTWTLGNEEPEKWNAWEPTWRAKRSTEEQKLLDLTNELRLDEAKRGGANALVQWEEVALHGLLALRSADFDLERNTRPTVCTCSRRLELRRRRRFAQPITLRTRAGRRK